MPVGTIRQWSSGAVIKAHENSQFGNGWVPLSTSTALENIGHACDRAANSMIHKKLPINGEKFLDHEISDFERKDGQKHGKYTPNDFKKYTMGQYSFREEFSRRFMKPKLDAWAKIDEELDDANRRKGEEQGLSWEEINKSVLLTSSEIKEIKARVRANMVYDPDYFTTKEAKELHDIVMRTKKQLDRGLDFEGDEKKAYDKALKIANSIPESYDQVPVKKELIRQTMDDMNEAFADNWGVRTSFKTYLEDKYSEYFQKYKKQIFIDEGARQEKLFGVTIDEDASTFYPKLSSRMGSMSVEQQQKELPFEELIELRFEALYSKQVKGEWTGALIPALEKIEKAINFLPEGHCLSNDNLRQITQQDYDGGSHGGYAWYSPSTKRINLSSEAASEANVWGRVGEFNEFESTLYHEIGHSVSQKLGRANSLKYKYFVKECGWSYSQQAAKEENGFVATGDQKDVVREGSRQHIPLLTQYAHKSPEEAFAEYYSLYATNKEAIDKWLKTGDERPLHKKEYFGMTNMFGGKETVGSTIPDRTSIDPETRERVEKAAGDSNLDVDKHITMDVINPWHSKVSDYDKPNFSAYHKVRHRKNWGLEKMPPVIAVGHSGKYEIIDGANRREQAKMNKFMLPSIVVSKELHNQLTMKGLGNEEIINYAYSMHKNSRVPKPAEKPIKIQGLDYRGQVISTKDIKKSEQIFRRMRGIYNSPELQKALEVVSLG